MEVCKNDRFPMFYGVVNRKSIYLIFELIKGDTLTKLYKNMSKQEKLSAVEQLYQILLFTTVYLMTMAVRSIL
jgi:predicted regulator of amino acid metabolism with ACT domain